MNGLKILFILIAFIGISSCKKAPYAGSDYVGYWRSSETCQPAIRIEENGDGSYENTDTQTDCQRFNSGHRGKARISKGELKIGMYKEPITLPPTLLDSIIILPYNTSPSQKSNMKMILGGETFYKVIQ